MFVNFVSLLLAIVFAGICLIIAMFVLWLSSRQDWFKITWAIALLALVTHVLAYAVYSDSPDTGAGAVMVSMLPVGTALLYGAAYQFTASRFAIKRVVFAVAASICVALPLLLAGYDGAAIMVQSLSAGLLLIFSGMVYFRNRDEAPMPFILLSSLYALAGSSFLLCAAVLALQREWVIGGVPDNWAEHLNVIIVIICLTGAGGFSIALDQIRIAQRHRRDAETDALTGLMNRRALFDIYGDRPFDGFSAITMFDLDRFKNVNDTYGHAVGDEVLQRFALAIEKYRRRGDVAARLGGEEFALIMPQITPEQARHLVGAIISAFEAETIETRLGVLRCTASAGISFGGSGGGTFDEVLARADKALYTAKKRGRNRIEIHELRIAAG